MYASTVLVAFTLAFSHVNGKVGGPNSVSFYQLICMDGVGFD